MYLLLLCTTFIVWVGVIPLALNRCSSVPSTVRTSRQRSCNQLVGCLQWLGSRAFQPAKRSGPRLLSNVPEILIILYIKVLLNSIWNWFLYNQSITIKSNLPMQWWKRGKKCVSSNQQYQREEEGKWRKRTQDAEKN